MSNNDTVIKRAQRTVQLKYNEFQESKRTKDARSVQHAFCSAYVSAFSIANIFLAEYGLEFVCDAKGNIVVKVIEEG